MHPPISHPRLRSVETIFVPHETLGRALLLRDGEGIAPAAIAIRADFAPVILSMDGTRSVDALARHVQLVGGPIIGAETIRKLVADLDTAYFLDSPRYLQRRREVVTAFKMRSERPAHHAGGAYHADAKLLRRFIDDDCLGKASPRMRDGRLVGVCAPHIDLWRGSVGYGHAYAALADALPDDVDTIFLLGTSHMPMRQPFAICDKPFATPLGAMSPDREASAWLAARSCFDVKEDEYLHKAEHSLEFQVVFLRHILGSRPVRIVPILCGLGRAISTGLDPAQDAAAESFIEALGELFRRRNGRAFLVIGADLAHIGPRFGDPNPLDASQRAALELRDRASVDRMITMDASGFYAHVREDLDTRRVCGLGPIYTALRVLPREVRGDVLHYAQCVDAEEGSIVSHASVAFYQ
jgi:AmmeMemoRadiSam system protein B